MTKKQNGILITGFLMLIFGFTAGSMISPDREFSEKENRVLQQMPNLNAEDIFNGKFSQKYEKYLSDQFFSRDEWIKIKTSIDRGLGKKEGNGVYFAKDGYLIETHKDDFQDASAFANIQTVANFTKSWSKVYGADHVKACIVPNAVDILSDKLPAFVENSVEQEYMKKVRESISSDNLIDAEEILLAHKDEELYYRTDHHWKTKAARYVYEAWADASGLAILPLSEYNETTLTDEFYGTVDAKVNTKVVPDSIEAFIPKDETAYELLYNHTEKRDSLYDESYLNTRDKYAVFFGGNQPIIEAKTKAGTGRKLLVLKDSYANCFLSFAMQDFDCVDIIDLRYLNEDLKTLMQEKDYTDILLLYNAAGFAKDTSISKLALALADES